LEKINEPAGALKVKIVEKTNITHVNAGKQ
jgi:hypothetical protein